MERLRRLASLWNFLPGFRAVAESEHLPTASELLFLSPSALSRTIHLLEENVGRPLFDRGGRRITLNSAGHKLLSGVRDAMRLVDDVLAAIGEQQMVGPIHIGASAPIVTLFILPVVLELRASHPDLLPSFHEISGTEIAHLLLRGQIDLAVGFDTVEHADIELRRLTTLSTSVYCTKHHPLAQKKRTSLEEIQDHPFIGPERDQDDGWPKELVRTVVISGPLPLRVEACLRGGLLAVLPDVIGARHRRLVALPSRTIGSLPLYTARRRTLVEGDKVEVLLARVQEQAKIIEEAASGVDG